MTEDFKELVEIMKKLRGPEGCPWDREQTHESIAHHLIEEAYEAVDAIREKKDDALAEELGDVLLQIVFHAQMAQERDAFNINDVIKGLIEKLIIRHPHIFGNESLKTPDEVLEQWEKLKKTKRRRGFLEGTPLSMPALLFALNVQKKSARLGFDWPEVKGIFEKILEESEELKKVSTGKFITEEVEEEIGDLLFSVVNLARYLKIDPESALRKVTLKFMERVQYVEKVVSEKGMKLSSLSLKEIDAIWEDAKRKERLK